jgi:ribosomal peptide maturation radical SAM protein 1
MPFRSKDPDQLYDEIIDLVHRYQLLDISIVDNILDMGYMKTLLPRLAESGYDLRMQVEIKSNLRREHLQQLRRAGMVSVQPGIESLNSRVLKLMDKGVTGCQNIRLLRDAESEGLTPYWNYLYGFPGEVKDDYMSILRQFPALHHLHPPTASGRVQIERFSPYFDREELGFRGKRPAGQYNLIYGLPECELQDIAYRFQAPERGIAADTVSLLEAAILEWEQKYPDSRLTYFDFDSQIVLVNKNRGLQWTTWHLCDPVELAAFRLLEQPHSAAGLARKLHLPDSTAEDLLQRWQMSGLLFVDNGQYIHLACEATNTDQFRIQQFTAESRLDSPQPLEAVAHG